MTDMISCRFGGVVLMAYFTVGCLGSGCGQDEGMASPMSRPDDLEVRQGTVGKLDDCLIGLVSVDAAVPEALLSLTSNRAGVIKNFLHVPVKAHQMVPICGSFRRVLRIEQTSGIGFVLLAREPVAVAEAAVAADALVMTPGSTGKFVPPDVTDASADVSARLLAITTSADGALHARFEVWPGAGRSSEAAPTQVVAMTVAAQGELALGGRRYRVGAIYAGDAAKNLPGFVEIKPQPL